ncbi:Holliday junction resolvase RecU [[Mycoplasma] gypis]|uniref:Holliday junction resolvase RecU n=1 Tax=[Mycoplasma] gypis TaxID=92404 RepID=A0ABZ2RRL0_9BACT|nr:Holliday junction resolvase RecU [[Mycoplasma] gypis]MBN0919259.1 Holliday junction resolvase RecU [[Mycoplasma] gypis]
MSKNKGMLLESIINQANENYFFLNKALIHKKNLDIKFTKIKNMDNKIFLEKARIVQKSTVDYYGVYQSKFIAFEAKETEDDNLPINNIKPHQIEYLNLINKFGGVGFYVIFFKKYNTFFYVDASNMHEFFKNKKSLSFNESKNIGHELKLIFPGILNYLDFINLH